MPKIMGSVHIFLRLIFSQILPQVSLFSMYIKCVNLLLVILLSATNAFYIIPQNTIVYHKLMVSLCPHVIYHVHQVCYLWVSITF